MGGHGICFDATRGRFDACEDAVRQASWTAVIEEEEEEEEEEEKEKEEKEEKEKEEKEEELL